MNDLDPSLGLTKRLRISEDPVFLLLLMVVASTPIFLIKDVSLWPAFAAAAQIGIAIWAIGQASRRAVWPPAGLASFNRLLWIAIGIEVYLAAKLIPLPPFVLGLLSPSALEVRMLAAVDPNALGWFPLSLDMGTGIREFLRVTFYFSLLVIVLIGTKSATHARWLAFALLGVTLVVVGEALVAHYLYDFAQGRAIGEFGNANLFAGFVAMGLAFATGLYFGQQMHADAQASKKGASVYLLDWLVSPMSALAAVIILLAVALYASGSRGGLAAVVLSLLVVLIVFLYYRGERRTRSAALLLGALLIATLGWFGSENVLKRLEAVSTDGAQRLSYWHSAERMFLDYPLVGMGGGTWRHAYARYRDPELREYSSPAHTHNDHLQMLVEHGVIGYFLFGGFMLTAIRLLIKGVASSRDPFLRGIILGALGAVLVMLFHGLVDNNFQVTVNVAYFYTILGLGLAATRLD